MKRRLPIVLMTFLCFFVSRSQAQNETCGFDSVMQYYQSLNPEWYDAFMQAATSRINAFRDNPPPLTYLQNNGGPVPLSTTYQKTTFVIPVAFHVFYDAGDTNTNISQQQIDNQVAVLNQTFDPIGIQFCVKVITRHNDSGVSRIMYKQQQMKALSNVVYSAYPADKFLNIYVVKTILDSAGNDAGLAGYNNLYPGMKGIDAIVVRYHRVGEAGCSGCTYVDAGSQGKTLVHEVGHYLGLFHTFQDECLGGTSASDCKLKGDRCCDTPPHLKPASDGCSTSPNTCTETYGGNAADPKHNYMNYTGEACINQFTDDQISIMRSALYGPRASLVNPTSVNSLGMSCTFKSAFFSADKFLVCTPDTVHFTAYAQSGAQYKWQVWSDSATYNGSFGSNSLFNYHLAKQVKYTITLTVVSGTDTFVLADSNMVQYRNCGSTIASTQGNWYFGNLAGLNFNTMMPTLDVMPYRTASTSGLPNINSEEGCISESNSQGMTLFYGGAEFDFLNPYTAKFRIFNRSYLEVAHSPIIGHYSSTQSAVVVPDPGNAARYYIFSQPGHEPDYRATNDPDYRGLRYSIFDTTMNDIDSNFKNVPIKNPLAGHEYSALDSAIVGGECITAIPSCDGSEYWVLVSGGTKAANHKDRLLVYQVTSSGVNFVRYHDSVIVSSGYQGNAYLKVSPDGLKLAGYDFLAYFDRANGAISRIFRLPPSNSGYSFSPNSKLLYSLDFNGDSIFQYDAESSNPPSSKSFIGKTDNSSIAGMQLGPDNKIYVSVNGKEYIAVINAPDSQVSLVHPNKCEYTINGPALSKNGIGGICKGSLPNMVDAKKENQVTPSIVAIDSACGNVQFFSTFSCANSYLWYFGDGDSSTLENPRHSYAVKGSYTVKVFTNSGDSIVKTIKIGIDNPIIGGPHYIGCDTLSTYEYSYTNRNDLFSFSWSLKNGSTISTDDGAGTTTIRWKADGGVIYLSLLNKANGCTSIDSIVVSPQPALTNIIGNSQLVCNTNALDSIGGNGATGGNGIYTYLWRVKYPGGNWLDITNSNDTIYRPDTLVDSTLYVRVAYSNGCEKISDTVVIETQLKNDSIFLAQRPCIPGQTFIVNGTKPYTQSDTDYIYKWQYSNDNLHWDTIAFADSIHLVSNYPKDSVYVRRITKTTGSGCEFTSNIIKVRPLIYFARQPRPRPACRYHISSESRFFDDLEMKSDTNVALHYFWELKLQGSTALWNDTSTWNPPYDTSASWFNSSGTSWPRVDSLRCIIFTPCGKIYSNVVPIYTNEPDMGRTFHLDPDSSPVSITVDEGDTVIFRTYELYTGLDYYWDVSVDGGETWSNIPGENNDTLMLLNVSRCLNKRKYRVRVFNGCDMMEYSDPATLTVTSSYVNSLMMRDATDDTGTEPYPNNNIWASPDIWFSRNSAATYDYNNNNIEYKKLTPIGYAKVQVKNTGSTTSPAQKVVVHWTVASTLELWPKHWLSTSDNIIINNVPSSPFYQDTFYRGGVIDTVTIGPMTAGSSQVIVLPWEVPNPAWYGVNGLDSSLMVCLLGRILTCDEKPYGMTFPEGLVTATNARNNRKIITRNFHVVDTASGDMQGKPGGGNYWAQNMNAAYNLKAVSCDYFDYGVVDIVMDDVLSNAWYANGAHGSGFTVIDDHTIRITDTCDVWLTDVAFGPNEETQVKIHFVTDESYERTTPMSFDFEWYQYNQDSLALDTPLADGGMMLRCDLPDNVAAHYLDNQILVTSSGIPYKHSICNGATPPPLIGSNPVTPAYWTYQWQSTTDTMGVWTDIPGATDRDYNPSINNMNMFYRRGALKQHALALNYSPIFFMRLRDPMILTPPANASVDEGDIATFIVSYQDMEVVNWTRTHSSIGTIIDETSDTLNFQTQECYNGNTFQAVLRDVCTSIETSTSSATLTVNPVSDLLYAQDNTSGSFIWSSPDMINRHDNDNGSTHQTPEFGNPNYIYTTVRNNGLDASAPAKLYLYWSVATTGAAWERNWKFDTTESAETGNWIMYQGAKTPLGGLIGIYDIPSIASSSYYRSETEWNPIDPAVYGLENTTLSDIILLGRIVTCEDEPYGMNPPEVNDLAYNVRYNERIISKHKIVTDVIPGNDVIHKAGNGNINDFSMDGRLVFKALDCDYFQYGYVLLHTDATLQSIWTNSDGSGYTIVDDSTLQVDSCQNALLWDIGYGANQRTWLGVEFVTWDTLTVDTTEDYYFEFDLEQYMNGDNDTSVGGIRYGVPIHLEPPAPESLIRKEDTKERITFSAYPNPFRDEMNITYKLPQDANVSITVVNMLGQQVRVLEQGNLKTAGTHRLLLNSSFLKEGIYFINFTAGSFTQTQKVVLIR